MPFPFLVVQLLLRVMLSQAAIGVLVLVTLLLPLKVILLFSLIFEVMGRGNPFQDKWPSIDIEQPY